MYLSAEKYISGYNTDSKPLIGRIMRLIGLKPSLISNDAPSITVRFNVAYWRKANQIHSWFVRECQGGVDDCRNAYVARETLQKLLEICKEVLASKNPDVAKKLLEPQSGFFFGSTEIEEWFGSTEIDEWYWDDLAHTVKVLENVLASKDLESCEFYYRSSW